MALIYFTHQQGYKNETIKQADVVLLGFPLGFNMSAAVRKNDLEYYGTIAQASQYEFKII